jgi:hypothetical protein
MSSRCAGEPAPVTHVDSVLKAIAASGLMLLPLKCHLGYRSIVILGNKVSRLGLSTHHKKLKATGNWMLQRIARNWRPF